MNVKVELKSCLDCIHHWKVDDPDPDDWFRDSDMKVVCRHSTVKKEERDVTGRLTVFEMKPKEVPIPHWCPLRPLQPDKIQDTDGEIIL